MKKYERIKPKSIDIDKFYELVDTIKKENKKELDYLGLNLSAYILQSGNSITIHKSLNNEKYNKLLMDALKECSTF